MAITLLLVLLVVLYGPAALESLRANVISIKSVRLAVNSPAIETDNRCHLLHVHGRAYYLQGQYDEAIAELERAAACNDYQWAWFDLGRAQYAAGQMNEAAESWRQADAFGYAEALAQYTMAAGDGETSFAAWKVAAAIDPNAVRPFVEMGKYLRTAGCLAEAYAVYEHLVTLEVSGELAAQTQTALNELAGAETDASLSCPVWP
jgi:tetratricopeptide (TPR) repeat protein